MAYSEKYIKYKSKNLGDIHQLLTGGSYQAFKDTGKFYMLAFLGNETLRRVQSRYLSAFGQQATKPFHFTLLQMDINKKSDFSAFLRNFINSNAVIFLAQNFKALANASNIELRSVRGNYKEMGNAVAKPYQISDQQFITNFRRDFYKIMTSEYKRQTQNTIRPGQQKSATDKKTGQSIKYQYFINNKGEELYAVPEWYYGAGVWIPHLSVGYTTDLHIPAQQIQHKFEASAQGPINAISRISLTTQISRIELSYSFGGPVSASASANV